MNPCGTMPLLAGAHRLGISRKRAYANAREHGALAPGIPVLPSFDSRLRVATSDVERYLGLHDRKAS